MTHTVTCPQCGWPTFVADPEPMTPKVLELLHDMLRPEDMHADAEALIERWESQARALLAQIEGKP